MTEKERHSLERKLLEEVQRIGDSVRDITPRGGLLTMTWFPNGHVGVSLYSGDEVIRDNGKVESVMILDAYGDAPNGKLQVHRL